MFGSALRLSRKRFCVAIMTSLEMVISTTGNPIWLVQGVIMADMLSWGLMNCKSRKLLISLVTYPNYKKKYGLNKNRKKIFY